MRSAKKSSYPEILGELCGDGKIATIDKFISPFVESLNFSNQWEVIFNITAAMLTLPHRKNDYLAFMTFVRSNENVRRAFHGNVIPVTISSR